MTHLGTITRFFECVQKYYQQEVISKWLALPSKPQYRSTCVAAMLLKILEVTGAPAPNTKQERKESEDVQGAMCCAITYTADHTNEHACH